MPAVLVEKLDILADVPNPQQFPWPYDDESVQEITCVNVFQFVPGKLRGKFMDEIYRILTSEGKAQFVVPYWNSYWAVADYRYEWPPLCEASFMFFNKQWREANNIKDDLKCDLHFTYGYVYEPETQARNLESQAFWVKHYTNSAISLQLTITKYPPVITNG